MGNQMRYLSKPVTDCHFEAGAGKSYVYTAASMQGWRKYQEDRYVCIPNFYEDCSFFGVYDGHGGSEIAEFLKQRLHSEVIHSLQTEDDIELALHLGFLSCDASILEPENIAELNDMVEEENRGTAMQILKNQRSLEAALSQAAGDQTGAGPSTKPSVSTQAPIRAPEPARAAPPPQDDSSQDISPQDISPPPNPSPFFHAMNPSYPGMLQFGIGSNPGPSEESIRAFIQREAEERMEVEEIEEVESPLSYLLTDDIEPSDPEDEDYDIEDDEESSSTESEEETNCISTEEFLNSEPGYLSGSTATVAIIRQNRIFVANVGDSRCVLSRKGQAIDMSLDHKPDDPEEQSRIIGAGGSVSEDGRVDNCLNLSRAFGDFKFKGDSLVPSQQCITAEPFIKSMDVESDDDFLIIASDGIWNSMSSQEVVDYINIRLKAGDGDLKDICEEMFKFTLASDKDNDGTGCDNMCCIIIRFGNKGDPSIYKASSSTTVASSDDSLKQEDKGVNAPTSSGAGQMTTCMSEKTSPVEKNFSQNDQNLQLAVQYPKQSIQHLVKFHEIDFSLQQEKGSENLILKSLIPTDEFKRFANHGSNTQENLPSSMCSLENASSPFKKGLNLKSSKLDHLGDIDYANSYVKQIMYHFKNTQSTEKQNLCNTYTSNIP